MNYARHGWIGIGLALCCLATGCQSMSHAERGTLFGGGTGAALGAVVGKASGNTGVGAVIGTGLGALTGAAIGSEMDEAEARNRALIEAQLGQQVRPGAVTVDQVIQMHRAGVNQELIVNHVRVHGMACPLQTQDLIVLQQHQVPVHVIKVMQEPPRQVAQPVYAAVPQPVLVPEYHYAPAWRPCPPPYRPHGPGPIHWTIGVGN